MVHVHRTLWIILSATLALFAAVAIRKLGDKVLDLTIEEVPD